MLRASVTAPPRRDPFLGESPQARVFQEQVLEVAMTHSQLHIGVEPTPRPEPAFVRAWFIALVGIAGFLLGLTVMALTSVVIPPEDEAPSPFEMIVVPR